MKSVKVILFCLLLIRCSPPGKIITAAKQGVNFNNIRNISLNTEQSIISAANIPPQDVFQVAEHTIASKHIQISDTSNHTMIIKVYDQHKSQNVNTTFYPEYSRAEKYTEGTINGRLQIESNKQVDFIEEWCIVSLIDKKQKIIVWEGGYVAMRDKNALPKYRHKQIVQSISYLIRKYPQ